MDKDGFQIYGGAGKSLLFGVLALLLLVDRKGNIPELKPWKAIQVIWLVLSGLVLATAWVSVNHLIHSSSTLIWILLAHLGIIVSVVLAALGTFGQINLRLLARLYKQELLISLGLAVSFFIFLSLVYGLWRVLAGIVLHSVQWLLHLCGLSAIILPPRGLLLSKFGITIAKTCSGIESIALFTALYVLVGVLDWRRFNHKRYLYIFQ